MRLLVLLLAAWALRAEFPVEKWKYRRPVSGEAAGLGTLALDRQVFAGARPDLADLRVARAGRELPYVLTVRSAAKRERLRDAEVTDRGVTARGMELTLDLGAEARHNRVRLVTPRHNYRENVLLEASPDRRAWAVVRTGAAIFDFTQDGRQVAVTDIDYPVSTRRYLRVTVAGWRDPAFVTGASVSCREPAREVRQLLAGPVRPEVKQEPRRSIATFDLGVEGLPVDRIDVQVAGGLFHRSVTVEDSPDGRAWSHAGTDSLARFGGGESLSLRIPETRRRYLRLIIHNGDDAPLAVPAAKFYGLERVLTVEGAGPGTYLYYGRPGAGRPDYDLARRLTGSPSALRLGPQEPNPDYRPDPDAARPWSERSPGLLWSILIGAICLIGFAVWRLLAGMKAAG